MDLSKTYMQSFLHYYNFNQHTIHIWYESLRSRFPTDLWTGEGLETNATAQGVQGDLTDDGTSELAEDDWEQG